MKIIVVALVIFSFLYSDEIKKRDLESENKKLIEKIKELENQIKNYSCKCDDENSFFELMMKKEYQEKNLQIQKVDVY
ncbi:MAG: hypothetical protein PHQ93_07220 [Sulfurimonas sp.]|uniref:hypothetical protein n=1 Tax=Sulfurimonas sp. TaxID=2022749 RepID=UPI0026083CE8|nr:hypothetical protein [Sulfurimonas sp.]MDD5400960.1 hypothetical protein [Sulfurimonas sp.]